MKAPQIPSIPGIKTLSALEMNSIHFSRRHTVLSPDQISTLVTPVTSQRVTSGAQEQTERGTVKDVVPKPVGEN